MKLPRFVWAGMSVGAAILAWKGFVMALTYAVRLAT